MTSDIVVSTADIIAAALKVFTAGELSSMPDPQRRSLANLIAKRLEQSGPPPTVEELEGIRELAEVHLWHPAFTAAS